MWKTYKSNSVRVCWPTLHVVVDTTRMRSTAAVVIFFSLIRETALTSLLELNSHKTKWGKQHHRHRRLLPGSELWIVSSYYEAHKILSWMGNDTETSKSEEVEWSGKTRDEIRRYRSDWSSEISTIPFFHRSRGECKWNSIKFWNRY